MFKGPAIFKKPRFSVTVNKAALLKRAAIIMHTRAYSRSGNEFSAMITLANFFRKMADPDGLIRFRTSIKRDYQREYRRKKCRRESQASASL